MGVWLLGGFNPYTAHHRLSELRALVAQIDAGDGEDVQRVPLQPLGVLAPRTGQHENRVGQPIRGKKCSMRLS